MKQTSNAKTMILPFINPPGRRCQRFLTTLGEPHSKSTLLAFIDSTGITVGVLCWTLQPPALEPAPNGKRRKFYVRLARKPSHRNQYLKGAPPTPKGKGRRMYISWRAARNLFQSQIQCQGERAIIRDKLKRPRFRRSLQCSQSAIPPAHGAACLGSATADLRELHLQQGLSGAGYGHRPSHNAWPLRARARRGNPTPPARVTRCNARLAHFDYALQAWGQGTVSVTVQPARKNLQRMHM
jgi:hypothetical protein